MDSEDNLHSDHRRTRPSVPAQRNDWRSYSYSNLFAFGDSDSNSNGKWYRVAYGNAKWHDKSHADPKRNSKC